MFILMIIVCWMITLRYSPEIIEKNGLKDIIGYDNLCVGFDAPPARYVAVPMQVMMAVLACRYSSLDTTRAALEFTHGNITRSQYWCSYIANTVYAGFLCCFPMLLVLTPDLSSGIATSTYGASDSGAIVAQFGAIILGASLRYGYIFFGMISTSFLDAHSSVTGNAPPPPPSPTSAARPRTSRCRAR